MLSLQKKTKQKKKNKITCLGVSKWDKYIRGNKYKSLIQEVHFYKATLYLKTILLKNVFLKRFVRMAGMTGDLFLKLYLVILVSGK